MRTLLTVLVGLAVTLQVHAQTEAAVENAAPAATAPAERGRPAPLATNPADIEPAVDVSRITTGTRAPRTTRPATAPTAPNVGTSRAIDSLDLGTTSITGNQELPKVLYIVPWKRSDLGDLVGRPVDTLLDEVLAPVDPEVFERHLNYYETLHGASQQE
jgi:hypothetical protein